MRKLIIDILFVQLVNNHNLQKAKDLNQCKTDYDFEVDNLKVVLDLIGYSYEDLTGLPASSKDTIYYSFYDTIEYNSIDNKIDEEHTKGNIAVLLGAICKATALNHKVRNLKINDNLKQLIEQCNKAADVVTF